MERELIGGRWGTWEELLLGGAVLRHGFNDWDVVAAELRSRALCSPYNFSPEDCKAKYEELQQLYSEECPVTLFEELRNKRMRELRQFLHLSEDSIGSLESKLENLKSDRESDFNNNYGSSRTESPVSFQKSPAFETSSKETSKDGLSAGSFTLETRRSCSSECQIPSAASVEETETKPEALHSSQPEKPSIVKRSFDDLHGRHGGTPKKRRGKRKRKDSSWEVKEASVGESGLLHSVDVVPASRSKDNLASHCAEVCRSSGSDNRNRSSNKDGIDDLLKIFNSVLEHKFATTFRHRLDSQKRGRYKKLIRKHVDLDTLRTRINGGLIMSLEELFRDLLLLANNALVFYSKNTREHKSALLLRDFTTKTLRQHFNNDSGSASAKLSPVPAISKPLVKPRSVRPGNQNLTRKAVSTETNAVAKAPKKSLGQPRKVGGKSNNDLQSTTPSKGRKRGRI
ncbi:hypothetical protein UlMin_011788, partial [Ulmus minor]